MLDLMDAPKPAPATAPPSVQALFPLLYNELRPPAAKRERPRAHRRGGIGEEVIDFVRRRNADRRGGGVEHVTLDTRAAEQLGASDDEILAVHDALETLAKVDPRLVSVVEMRYFAGLSDAEIASALGLSDRTVRRDWDRARLLLAEMLGR